MVGLRLSPARLPGSVAPALSGGRDRRRSGDLALFSWNQGSRSVPSSTGQFAKAQLEGIARKKTAPADRSRTRDARGISRDGAAGDDAVDRRGDRARRVVVVPSALHRGAL